MTEQKKASDETTIKAIFVLLKKFNSLFSKHQSEPDEKLQFWAQYLFSRRTTVKQVSFALNELSKNGLTFMPSSHEILGVLIPAREPKEYRAEKIATEIHEAVLETIAGNKSNFLDDLSLEAKAVVTAMGGYRVLRETDLSKDINRARLVRGALGLLTATEIESRNAKLSDMGIPCSNIVSIDLQKLQLEMGIDSTPRNRPEVPAGDNILRSINLTTEMLGQEFKSMREAIDQPGEKNG